MTPENAAQLRAASDAIQPDMSLTWGAYNPLLDCHEEKKLVDLDSDHLENILVSQPISPVYRRTIARILRERGPNDHTPRFAALEKQRTAQEPLIEDE